jgi:hypothetical protein
VVRHFPLSLDAFSGNDHFRAITRPQLQGRLKKRLFQNAPHASIEKLLSEWVRLLLGVTARVSGGRRG